MARLKGINWGGGGMNSLNWRQKYCVLLLHLLVHGLVFCDDKHEQIAEIDNDSASCSSHDNINNGPLHLQTFDLSSGSLVHTFSNAIASGQTRYCARKLGGSRVTRRMVDSEHSKHFFLTTGGEGLGRYPAK